MSSISTGRSNVRSKYEEMTGYALRKLLVERGLKTTDNKSRAIRRLENQDNALPVVHAVEPPELFQPSITGPSTATVQYCDPTKPFHGVPFNIIVLYIMRHLDYSSLRSMGRTCKNFHGPAMKLICEQFRLFLVAQTEALKFPMIVHHTRCYILETGKGITPMAASYAYKYCYETCPKKKKNKPIINSVLNDIVSLIHSSGTFNIGITNRRIQATEDLAEAVAIRERLKEMQIRLRQSKYDIDLNPESPDAKRFFSRRIGRHLYPENANFKLARKARSTLDRYILAGVEFDWKNLDSYLDFLMPSYNFALRQVEVPVCSPPVAFPRIVLKIPIRFFNREQEVGFKSVAEPVSEISIPSPVSRRRPRDDVNELEAEMHEREVGFKSVAEPVSEISISRKRPRDEERDPEDEGLDEEEFLSCYCGNSSTSICFCLI